MNSPTPPADTPPAPPADGAAAPAPSPVAKAARGIGWLGLWLPGALLALLVAGLAALWIWTGSPGSLARALQWAQSYTAERAASTGQLQAEGVQGSLRTGGRIAQLRWSRDGLQVQASGLRLDLGPDAWLDALRGRGLLVQGLHIERVVVRDERAPTPLEPLQPISLPFAVTLPWTVGEVRIEKPGSQPVSLTQLKGLYRYGSTEAAWAQEVPDSHHLRLDTLQLASGQYRGQAVLGAQMPLPLALELHGELTAPVPNGNSLRLQAQAQASGTLGGEAAALDLSAHVLPLPARDSTPSKPSPPSAPPALAASARVKPWARQPLETAHVLAHQLDLSLLWPTAPVTLLSGTVNAQPQGEAWQAQVDLRNEASGPGDRQRLPLQRLKALVEQRGEQWTLAGIDAQVGGGRLQGDAQVAWSSGINNVQGMKAWQADLQLRGINPTQLWSKLAPAALDGTLSARTVTAENGREAFDLDTRIQPSGRQPPAGALAGVRLRELQLQGRWQPSPTDPAQGVLQLRQARLQVADARLETQGQMDTAARTFAGQLDLQLPGASLQWKGLLAHHSGEGDTRLQLDDAQRVLGWLRSLQAVPVLGRLLQAQLDQHPGLSAQGSARLNAQWQGGLGALGYPAPLSPQPGAAAPALPRVQLALDVPRLLLQPGAAGPNAGAPAPIGVSDLKLQASGRLDDVQLQMSGAATQAPWRASLDTQGRVKTGGAATPLASGQLDLGRLSAVISHSPLPAASTNGSNSPAPAPPSTTEWTLQSARPLALRWQGGPPRPAAELRLQLEAGQLQLQPALRNAAGQRIAAPEFDSGPLTLAWEPLIWQAHTLQTKGSVRGLPLAWVDVLGRAAGARAGPLTQAGLSGNLVFDGNWDVLLPTDARTPLRLSAQLQRSSGDLSVQTDGGAAEGSLPPPRSGVQVAPALLGQRLQAGIREASLNISAQGQQVQARLRWDSQRLGEASADLATELSLGNISTSSNPIDRWWPASAPLRGTASARLPQVGVWSALAPPGWRMRGTLIADATISGTRAAPQWSGTLQADQLALRSVVDGFAFSNGQLRATLSGERIVIQRFTLQGPRGTEPGGTLEATGTAEWRAVPGSALRQPFIDLQATATRLRVSNRADRRLTLSGQVSAQLAGPRLVVRGRLDVDSALIVLPDENVPTLGADVVVRGTREPEDPDAVRVQPDVLVDVDLGEQFEVRGRGLQTRLAGQLSVRSTPGTSTPRVLGEVRTVSGTYRAYGQQLSIETGVLRFTGPYDNPTLDVLAVRPQQGNTDMRVGVQITGTAQVPRVRLFSDPEMPDSEKLAWLLLGRPATGAGAEAAVLQQAAMALLARNRSGSEQGLAGIVGLDELGFRGQTTNADGSTTSAALTLGKRLSNDLYVSYERSLAGTLGTVSIFYDISRRLTVRARAGEENAIDLIFTLRYD